MNFTIDPQLAQPPGDELGELGAEIEDQDALVHRARLPERVPALQWQHCWRPPGLCYMPLRFGGRADGKLHGAEAARAWWNW